jgi:16S rRNA (guanine(1405)-N(7))-methyltransferase
MESPPPPIDALVSAVRESAKYRAVCPSVIRRIGLRALAEEKSMKDAVKATKNKLHQIAGAYFAGKMRYEEWLDALSEAAERGDSEEIRRICREAMSRHASSSERLPNLESFYRTIFAEMPPVRSVSDVACGLNPLSLPWMPLEPGAAYRAYDLFEDMASFLNGFFRILGVPGAAEARDALDEPPERGADLALVLKALPVFERTRKSSSVETLRRIPAEYLLVSFPSRSLGGREKGMAANYERQFLEGIREEGWSIRRFEFPNELAFLIRKRN